jgi:hypothetical protein
MEEKECKGEIYDFDSALRWSLGLKRAAVCAGEIPRPAGENAGLRDDAGEDCGLSQL